MELSETIRSMKKLLLSYMKLGSRREVSWSKSNVVALCSRQTRKEDGPRVYCALRACLVLNKAGGEYSNPSSPLSQTLA